jgi:glycosyltransferase involved in cell wall biosynthesis
MRYTFIVNNGRQAFIDPEFEGGGLAEAEAALVLLTRELTLAGNGVEVFGASDVEGVFHGVRYQRLSRFNLHGRHDVLVVFRRSWPSLDKAKARAKVYWSTELEMAEGDASMFPLVDRILCMSQFHLEVLKQKYPSLNADSWQVLGGGILHEDYFERPPDQLPTKPGNLLIHFSGPDRGLLHLARLFPRIREAAPDAELAIILSAGLGGSSPEASQFVGAFEKLPGVRFYGKVSRRELVRLQKQAKVMAHPSEAGEAFCLATLECIAAGAVPATTNDFALRTAVGQSGVLIPGRPGQADYDDQFVVKTVELLREEKLREETAHCGRRRAFDEFRWSLVAERFGKLVNPPEAAVEVNTVNGPAGAAASRNPSIAVIIPVHNQAQWLYRAIASVIWQLKPMDELIVVDDGSTETRGFEELEPFRRRILWLRNSEKRGVSHARNRAIDRSRSDWIKFLDADDVLAPFALDLLRDSAEGMPAFVQVVAGACHRLCNGRYHDLVADAFERFREIEKANPIPASASFVRRKALVAVGMFDERIDFEEDWDLWLRIHERYGEDAFGVSERPVCYIRDSSAERHFGPRRFTVDGVPVREYFRKRYGWESGDPEWAGKGDCGNAKAQNRKGSDEVLVAKEGIEVFEGESAVRSGTPGGGAGPSGEVEKTKFILDAPVVLNGERPRRVIAGWSDSGLCDRLTNMLLARAVGRKSGREVQWHWPLLPACNCPFHELFECDEISFLASPSEAGPQIGGRFMPVAEIFRGASANEAEPSLRINWGYFGHNYDAFDAVFRPSANVAALALKFKEEHWQDQMFGVHVRRTDRHPHCPSVADYMTVVDMVLARWPAASLFLATDDPGCSMAFTQRFGRRVVSYPARTLRRDVAAGIVDAVVTLYLLRQTRGVVGSRISGYSLCAGWDCGFLDVPFDGRSANHPWEGEKFIFRGFNLDAINTRGAP